MKNLRLLRQPIYGSKTAFLPFALSAYKTFLPSFYKKKANHTAQISRPLALKKLKQAPSENS